MIDLLPVGLNFLLIELDFFLLVLDMFPIMFDFVLLAFDLILQVVDLFQVLNILPFSRSFSPGSWPHLFFVLDLDVLYLVSTLWRLSLIPGA